MGDSADRTMLRWILIGVVAALAVGRVMPIFGQQWNLALEPFYVVAHYGPSARWGFRFGISLLLPER